MAYGFNDDKSKNDLSGYMGFPDYSDPTDISNGVSIGSSETTIGTVTADGFIQCYCVETTYSTDNYLYVNVLINGDIADRICAYFPSGAGSLTYNFSFLSGIIPVKSGDVITMQAVSGNSVSGGAWYLPPR